MLRSQNCEIVVAVTTFRRARQLAEGLPRIVEQASASAHDVAVVVVDNDNEPSARAFVTELSTDVHYIHEPRPGVSAARNAALDAASEARALIYVDDDTVPGPGWLDAMIDAWARDRPAAVSGSTVFTFDSDADAPYARGWGEFEPSRRPTGASCDSAASRNLLLDVGFLRAHDLRFDEHLGLIGGEDTLLTRQVTAAGGSILWCDEACVTEAVPASRVTRPWLLRRAFRSGGSWAYAVIRTAKSGPRRTRARLLRRAVPIMVVRSTAAALAVAMQRRVAARRAWRDVVSQAGVLAICLGARGMREYGRGR